MSQPSFLPDPVRALRDIPADSGQAAEGSPLEALRLQIDRHDSAGMLPTGMEELDRLLKGGIPRGKLVELTGRLSSGKTSLLVSILARATREEEFVAYIDAFDSLDPESASKAGVDLQRLLWIRCGRGGENRDTALGKALKAADILAQAGGFGVIALDLQPPEEQRGCRIPLHSWFRIQRALKGTPCAVLVISRFRTAGSAAALVLSLERQNSCWSHQASRSADVRFRVGSSACDTPSAEKGSSSSMGNSLQGLETQARLLRGASCGTVQVFCSF